MDNVEATNSSKIAEGIFIDVSYREPTSIMNQAVKIAVHCIERGLNPLDLMTQLLGDRESLDRIRKLACRTHSARGNGPTEIPEDRLKGIIKSDFGIANALMVLSPKQLIDLQSFIASQGGRPLDSFYRVRDKIEELLQRQVFF